MSNRFDLLEIDDVKPGETRDLGKLENYAAPVPVEPKVVPVKAPIAPITLAAVPKVDVKSEMIAVETHDETTGAVIYWALSGDLDLAKVRAAWGDLPEAWLPEPPSPATALSRAAKEEQDRNTLVRKHPLGGWSFVAERNVDGQLTYDVGVRIFLDANDVPMCGEESAHDNETFQRVNQAFHRNLSTVAATDVSTWLIRTMGRLNAVTLRDRGGVYFVPKDKVETFRALRNAIKAGSAHSISTIPALRSSDAIAAILDAVTREASELLEETRKVISEQLGVRAAKTRSDALEALKAKVASYEKLLGVKMDAVNAQLADLGVQLKKHIPWFSTLDVD